MTHSQQSFLGSWATALSEGTLLQWHTKRNLSTVQKAEVTVVTSRCGVRPIWQVFVLPLSPSRRMAGHCLKLGFCRFFPRPTICRYTDIIPLQLADPPSRGTCQISSSNIDKYGKLICSTTETETHRQLYVDRETICSPTYWHLSSINHKQTNKYANKCLNK
jgi:hypothetical protein